MAAAHAGRLHAPRCREVGRTEAQSLHAWACAGDLFDVRDTKRRLQNRVDEDRSLHAPSRLEQSEQSIDEVDVPRPLDLRNHDHVDLVAHLLDDLGHVVEEPGAVEAVHAGPELAVAEVVVLRDLDEALARRDLVVGLHRVLEVAEKHVALRRDARRLGRHLGIARVEEVDHSRWPKRDLTSGLGRPDGHGLEEVLGVSHRALVLDAIWGRCKVSSEAVERSIWKSE